MANNYQQLSHYARFCLLLSYSALLLLFAVNTLVVPSCNRSPNIVIFLLHLLPLLVFLPSLLKQNVRAHAWMTFVLLGYFMMSVSTAFACKSILLTTEVLLIAALFIAAMLYIRWRSRELKQLAADVSEGVSNLNPNTAARNDSKQNSE
jgi:uncharacterized membrane protein